MNTALGGIPSSEKSHGAVVGQDGTHNTQVFRKVSRPGKILGKLADLAGGRATAEVVVVFDWENRWAIEGTRELLFLRNFTPEAKHISLGDGGYTDLISEQHAENELSLEPYGSAVLVDGQNRLNSLSEPEETCRNDRRDA